MAAKFYAVRIGREPGIYLSWLRAQIHVDGYPGSQFKSFTTMAAARDYMGWPPEVIVAQTPEVKAEKLAKETKKVKTEGLTVIIPSEDPRVVEIYTDGSHQRKSDYLGIGAWCRYQGGTYELSARVTRKMLKEYGVADDAICSNPTAEFIAFAEILKRCAPIRFTGIIRFFIDYNGVERWMLGVNKTKAAHIIKVHQFCTKLMKDVTFKVEYVHVKGHSGVEGNEKADALAGDQKEIDTFSDLLKRLPI